MINALAKEVKELREQNEHLIFLLETRFLSETLTPKLENRK